MHGSNQKFDDFDEGVELGEKTGAISGKQSTRSYNVRSNWVQKGTIIFTAVMTAMLIVVISVTSATFAKVSKLKNADTVTTAYQSLGLPGYEGYAWNDVVAVAAGQTVNFFTYDDQGPYNNWIDTWLTPNLLENYNIKLVRHPLQDTTTAVNEVINQIKNGYGMNNGTIDMIWINGENFATMKNGGYAYGPWSTKVPNAANFDFEADSIKYDFGTLTSGLEMPYNEAQVIFIRNNATVAESDVSTIDDIITWVKANSGKFTYAAPHLDYTGSVFIRHVLYSVASPYTQFFGTYNEALYRSYAPKLFQTLRAIEPFLYNANTLPANTYVASTSGMNYPIDQEGVDTLFGSGSISLTLSYDVGHATNKIQNGVWPSTSMGYVLTSGTIANTNFVLIPANSAHKLGAVVAGNYIASAQAMFSRAQPEVIGALQAYDPTCSTFVAGGWNDAFDYIDRAPSTPPTSLLAQYRLSEINADYVNAIQNDWQTCVLNYQSGAYSYCG